MLKKINVVENDILIPVAFKTELINKSSKTKTNFSVIEILFITVFTVSPFIVCASFFHSGIKTSNPSGAISDGNNP